MAINDVDEAIGSISVLDPLPHKMAVSRKRDRSSSVDPVRNSPSGINTDTIPCEFCHSTGKPR